MLRARLLPLPRRLTAADADSSPVAAPPSTNRFAKSPCCSIGIQSISAVRVLAGVGQLCLAASTARHPGSSQYTGVMCFWPFRQKAWMSLYWPLIILRCQQCKHATTRCSARIASKHVGVACSHPTRQYALRSANEPPCSAQCSAAVSRSAQQFSHGPANWTPAIARTPPCPRFEKTRLNAHASRLCGRADGTKLGALACTNQAERSCREVQKQCPFFL